MEGRGYYTYIGSLLQFLHQHNYLIAELHCKPYRFINLFPQQQQQQQHSASAPARVDARFYFLLEESVFSFDDLSFCPFKPPLRKQAYTYMHVMPCSRNRITLRKRKVFRRDLFKKKFILFTPPPLNYQYLLIPLLTL